MSKSAREKFRDWQASESGVLGITTEGHDALLKTSEHAAAVGFPNMYDIARSALVPKNAAKRAIEFLDNLK